jgi:membrane protease YdiL (CAAX protease family)
MRELIRFFLLAYAISWLVWAPLWLPALGIHGLPVLPWNHALGGLGPLLSAVICTATFRGREGLRALGRNVFTLRGHGYLLVALLAPFVLAALSIALSAILHGTDPAIAGLLRNKEFPQWSLAGLFAYNLVFFGFGEEVGWRGFALPRFQRTHSALWSSVLLAVFWAAWHIPLFLYRPGYTSMDAAGAFGWLVSLLTGSVLLTWLFNSTRGSLLAVAVFHATVDIPFTADLPDARIMGYLGMFITLWGVATVVVFKPRDLSKVPTRQRV